MIRENDLIELLYQGKTGEFLDDGCLDTYLAGCSTLAQEPVFQRQDLPDQPHLHWSMPEKYQTLDLASYFAAKITGPEQVERVCLELSLFQENGLEPMLRYMIYMVDVMRDNNIVWGVGRGSSVSSYLLFLIGLHSVDAIKYDLDIKEFIK